MTSFEPALKVLKTPTRTLGDFKRSINHGSPKKYDIQDNECVLRISSASAHVFKQWLLQCILQLFPQFNNLQTLVSKDHVMRLPVNQQPPNISSRRKIVCCTIDKEKIKDTI